MKRIIISLPIVAMLFVGADAWSSKNVKQSTGQAPTMPMFSDLDVNGDRVIVAEEFAEARSKRMAEQAAKGGKMKNAANAPTFESIDTNGDGEISVEEFGTHKVEMMKNRQQRTKIN